MLGLWVVPAAPEGQEFCGRAVAGLREGSQETSRFLRIGTGDEHILIGGRQRLGDVDDLIGRLASAVDDFGRAGTGGPIQVDGAVRQSCGRVFWLSHVAFHRSAGAD